MRGAPTRIDPPMASTDIPVPAAIRRWLSLRFKIGDLACNVKNLRWNTGPVWLFPERS